MQKLRDEDYPKRVKFARWMLRQLRRDRNFFQKICFTDESLFTQKEVLNSQNRRYWAIKGQNPHQIHEVENQKRWKILVWAGVVGDRVVGPIFFDRNLNGKLYAGFLRRVLPRLLEDNPIDLQNMWWQQDGAPPHSVTEARQNITRLFQAKWIGNKGPVQWPARSPDLSICDFWLWGILKDRCYKRRPTTKQDMINRITREIAAITPQQIKKARKSIQKRIELIVQHNGRHIQQYL